MPEVNDIRPLDPDRSIQPFPGRIGIDSVGSTASTESVTDGEKREQPLGERNDQHHGENQDKESGRKKPLSLDENVGSIIDTKDTGVGVQFIGTASSPPINDKRGEEKGDTLLEPSIYVASYGSSGKKPLSKNPVYPEVPSSGTNKGNLPGDRNIGTNIDVKR